MAGREDSRSYPFVAFRFAVEIEGLSGGFSECSGLDLETDVLEYAEGGVNDFVHRLPGHVKQRNLVLKRGILDRGLWDWYLGTRPGRVKTRSGSVLLLGGGGEAQLTWRFDGAFPVRIEGPRLAADQSQVAIETLELAHRGLSVQAPPGPARS